MKFRPIVRQQLYEQVRKCNNSESEQQCPQTTIDNNNADKISLLVHNMLRTGNTVVVKDDLVLKLDLKWNKDLIQKESSERFTTK